jgi:hypothetical protein
MEIDLKGCLNREKRMERELIIYLMELFIKVSGLMEEFKVRVFANGKMAEDTREHG